MVVGRSPVRIDEDSAAITREVRVLPNKLHRAFCDLILLSFQELREADWGTIYTVQEEDPIEFFGIDPEEYIDVNEIIRRYGEEEMYGYNNE